MFIEGARRSETVARLDAEKALSAAEEAKRREERARQEAETNFDMARSAVEDYLTSVSENTLLKEQESLDIRTLRQDLLQNALAYYEEFAKERENDPRLRRQLAKAYFRVGLINGEIDLHAKGIEALEAAVEIWSPIYTDNPADPDAAENLSECYLAAGKLQLLEHDYSAAMKSLDESRAILEKLGADYPSEPRFKARLAACYSEIGTVYARLEQLTRSLEIHKKARSVQQGLVEQYPDELAYRKSLAEMINAIGFAHSRQPDNVAAINAFLEVRDICEKTMRELAAGAKPVWLLNLLALSQFNIGVIHKFDRKLDESLKFLEQSLKSRSALVDAHSSVTSFQEKLAVTHFEIADVHKLAHDQAKAVKAINKSIDVLSALVRTHPEQASFHNSLAHYLNYLGTLQAAARNSAEAIGPLQNAITEQNLAIAKSENAEVYRAQLCHHLEDLGEELVHEGKVADGLKCYDKAIKTRVNLHSAHPDSKEYAAALVDALINLGAVRRHLGESATARQLFKQAQNIIEKLPSALAPDEAFKVSQVILLDQDAKTRIDEKQPGLALPLLVQSTSLFRQHAARAAPANQVAFEAGLWSEALWDYASVLGDLSKTNEAERALGERRGLLDQRSVDELIDLALLRLKRANTIDYGITPVSDQAAAVRERDLAEAADLAERAISRDRNAIAKLKADPDSKTLLQRAELRALIEGAQPTTTPSAEAPSEKKAKGPDIRRCALVVVCSRH